MMNFSESHTDVEKWIIWDIEKLPRGCWDS